MSGKKGLLSKIITVNAGTLEYYSPLLTSYSALHWLPVAFRIDFKVVLLTYKALNGLGPNCITNSLINYLPSRTLRSSAAGLLEIPATAERKSGMQPLSITPQNYGTHCPWISEKPAP